MPLLSLRNIHFTWGGPPLLDGISLEVEQGDRIGLLGRNGAGKSTLMKIMDGEVTPDDGQLIPSKDLRIARLIQEVPDGGDETVSSIIEHGFSEEEADTNAALPDDWDAQRAVERILTRMSLDGSVRFGMLSSGMKRRVLLARALVYQPNLLLLDEPTNHLDIEAISWLERFLKGYNGTLVFVTHDRLFLQSLATRIVEVDRGRLFDWTCDYPTFLVRKEAALHAEERQNKLFDKKLAQEEVWIRQGIKARRTRNEGRVRSLKKMRNERQQRQNRIGQVRMQAVDANRSGQMVIEAKKVSFTYPGVETAVIDSFSTQLSRGDKLGIIGPNGAGKTTLLKLLLGELQPNEGSIRHGTRLEIIYFDQLREQIDEEKTVAENVGEGQDMLEINGKPKHIYGYLQEFLFTPERARRPARYLSGGERNRLLLARLFKRQSNVMVLDEPTNDLDAETLELLEELVTSYSGTLLLVSHDRAFLNNVVTGIFAFEGDGAIKEYAGGYDDYVTQRSASADDSSVVSTENGASANGSSTKKSTSQKSASSKSANSKTAKLSYRDQRELESLPETIGAFENEQETLIATMAGPSFYQQSQAEIAKVSQRLESLKTELEQAYSRWEELDARR